MIHFSLSSPDVDLARSVIGSISPSTTPFIVQEARELILRGCPHFNLEGLDDVNLQRLAAIAQLRADGFEQLQKPMQANRVDQLIDLIEHQSLAFDPITALNSMPCLLQALCLAQGDLSRVVEILGLTDTPDSIDHLHYLFRAADLLPADLVPSANPEFREFAESVKAAVTYRGLDLDVIEWSSSRAFSRLWSPSVRAILRGMRAMDTDGMLNILEVGIESPLLRSLKGDDASLYRALEGSTFAEVFKKHYAGAGLGEEYWRSPDDSPFVACGRVDKKSPIWHASRPVETGFPVIFEMAPGGSERYQGYKFEGRADRRSSLDAPAVITHMDEVVIFPRIRPEHIVRIHLLPEPVPVPETISFGTVLSSFRGMPGMGDAFTFP